MKHFFSNNLIIDTGLTGAVKLHRLMHCT